MFRDNPRKSAMTDSSRTAGRQQDPRRVGPPQYGLARADRPEREAPVDPRPTKWAIFIREHLTRKGWTQSKLAEAVEVTGSAVSRWIKSDQKPEIASIRAVAAAFDVQVVDALIAAEAVTEDELRSARVAPDPELLSDEQLFHLLAKRAGRRDLAAVILPEA